MDPDQRLLLRTVICACTICKRYVHTPPYFSTIFVEPTCGERGIVVTTSVQCMCVVHVCIRLEFSGPQLVHLRMDFKIICHICSP